MTQCEITKISIPVWVSCSKPNWIQTQPRPQIRAVVPRADVVSGGYDLDGISELSNVGEGGEVARDGDLLAVGVVDARGGDGASGAGDGDDRAQGVEMLVALPLAAVPVANEESVEFRLIGEAVSRSAGQRALANDVLVVPEVVDGPEGRAAQQEDHLDPSVVGVVLGSEAERGDVVTRQAVLIVPGRVLARDRLVAVGVVGEGHQRRARLGPLEMVARFPIPVDVGRSPIARRIAQGPVAGAVIDVGGAEGVGDAPVLPDEPIGGVIRPGQPGSDGN